MRTCRGCPTSREGALYTLWRTPRGWANYHQHAVAKKTFSSMDTAIYQLLRQWTRRRPRVRQFIGKNRRFRNAAPAFIGVSAPIF
ncbi:group II intron maturase-specific domain-containing protein [Acidithiobacillus ferrooxidans]|uniref:group II intron maturase-specific domain-containing protein n=1 Tax=Acidithiobacillus ferrooxidans TaxID=920 RepID=UPI003D184D9E